MQFVKWMPFEVLIQGRSSAIYSYQAHWSISVESAYASQVHIQDLLFVLT